jgi:hypothetical protein
MTLLNAAAARKGSQRMQGSAQHAEIQNNRVRSEAAKDSHVKRIKSKVRSRVEHLFAVTSWRAAISWDECACTARGIRRSASMKGGRPRLFAK